MLRNETYIFKQEGDLTLDRTREGSGGFPVTWYLHLEVRCLSGRGFSQTQGTELSSGVTGQPTMV